MIMNDLFTRTEDWGTNDYLAMGERGKKNARWDLLMGMR